MIVDDMKTLDIARVLQDRIETLVRSRDDAIVGKAESEKEKA